MNLKSSMNLSEGEKERYSRHLMLDQFGPDAQLKLKESSVLVVGAGGLGCPCLLYLAAAGTGHIGIADDDVVSLSNLQRQILYDTDDIGKSKCEVARQKLLKKNNQIRITAFNTRITSEKALEILCDFDVIIDGSDNFATRYLLNDACVILNKPLIYGALFKFEGQVSTFNYKEGPTYRCLFPESPKTGEMPGCAETGVIGFLPGIIGTWQAAEAIKVITGTGKPLSGKLLLFDMLSNNISFLQFSLSPENRNISSLGRYEQFCSTEVRGVGPETLLKWQEEEVSLQLIDVREEYEFDRFNIGGENIPFCCLEEKLPAIDPNKVTVVVCQSGQRSKKAVGMIKERFNFIQIFNLEGGLNALHF